MFGWKINSGKDFLEGYIYHRVKKYGEFPLDMAKYISPKFLAISFYGLPRLPEESLFG